MKKTSSSAFAGRSERLRRQFGQARVESSQIVRHFVQ